MNLIIIFTLVVLNFSSCSNNQEEQLSFKTKNIQFDTITPKSFEKFFLINCENDIIIENAFDSIVNSKNIKLESKLYLFDVICQYSDGYVSTSIGYSLAKIFFDEPIDFIMNINKMNDSDCLRFLLEDGIDTYKQYYPEIYYMTKAMLEDKNNMKYIKDFMQEYFNE